MNKVEVEVEKAVMGLGEGHPLFLDQTEARRAEKNFFETGPLPFVRVWMTRPPPFVRVWMTGPPLPPLYKGLVPPLKTTDYSETEKVTL